MQDWAPKQLGEIKKNWKPTVIRKPKMPLIKSIKKGGYILRDCGKKIDAILVSSGSEVHLCVEAAEKLNDKGVKIRVISIPCLEEFLSQPGSYYKKLIPENFNNILAVEAGIGVCWDKIIGKNGSKITMNSFGLSAPGDQALEYFGFTTPNVIKQVKKLIKKNR